MTRTFHRQVIGAVLFATAGVAHADEAAPRFVSEEDNFSVVMPGRVNRQEIAPDTRQYHCVAQESPTSRAEYLIIVGKRPTEIDSVTCLQSSRDNRIRSLRKVFPDMALLWSTMVRCSGYPGLQYTCIYNRIKRGVSGEDFELPSGNDIRLLRVGERLYTIAVNYPIYDPVWKVTTGYRDTPRPSRQFFASFRLLKKVDVPAATEKDSLLGEWITSSQKKNASQSVSSVEVPAPDYVFRENGEVLELLKGTYKTKDDQEPRQIDMVFELFPDNIIRKGIYKITDGSLQLCLGNENASSRPTRFEETGKQSLLNLSRPGDPILAETN